jgi:hypothetical protein
VANTNDARPATPARALQERPGLGREASRLRARTTADGSEQASHEEAGDQQLRPGRKATGAVPPPSSVEQLRPSRPRQPNDVLHVWSAGRERTDRRGVGDAASKRQEADQHEPAADLEAPVMKIAMRDPVARKMKRNAEQRCGGARADGSANGCARGDVQGYDHDLLGTSLRRRLPTEIACRSR